MSIVATPCYDLLHDVVITLGCQLWDVRIMPNYCTMVG